MSDVPSRGQLVLEKDLEAYLAFTGERERLFLAAPPEIFTLAKEVDSLIRDVLKDSGAVEAISMLLNMNAYYSFLAAVRCVVCGHVSPMFPLLRASLESACYAFLLTKDTALLQIWMDREKGEAENRLCRTTFGPAVKRTSEALRTIQPEMADQVQHLYDVSLTFGAHPNPSSVFRHIDVDANRSDGKVAISFTAVYNETSFEIKHALLACADYGLAIAYINVQSVKTQPDVKGLNHRFNAVNELKNDMEDKLRVEAEAG